jgi:hypothetical protein
MSARFPWLLVFIHLLADFTPGDLSVLEKGLLQSSIHLWICTFLLQFYQFCFSYVAACSCTLRMAMILGGHPGLCEILALGFSLLRSLPLLVLA